MAKELGLKPHCGCLGLALCCVTHSRIIRSWHHITQWGTGGELLAPLGSPTAGGEMASAHPWAVNFPVSVGSMEAVSM